MCGPSAAVLNYKLLVVVVSDRPTDVRGDETLGRAPASDPITTCRLVCISFVSDDELTCQHSSASRARQHVSSRGGRAVQRGPLVTVIRSVNSRSQPMCSLLLCVASVRRSKSSTKIITVARCCWPLLFFGPFYGAIAVPSVTRCRCCR